MKLHYYHFVFGETPDGVGQHYTSASVGLTEPLVTRTVIKGALKTAGASPEAVMFSCAYLGHMTSEQFNG